MRCERCFSRIIENEKEGPCIISQEDDGLDVVTLEVEQGGRRDVYILTQAVIAPLLRESWATILEQIEPYRVKADSSDDTR